MFGVVLVIALAGCGNALGQGSAQELASNLRLQLSELETGSRAANALAGT